MRAPVRYRIKGNPEDQYHYVVLGGNGEPMSHSEKFATVGAAEDRVTRAWVAHARSILGQLTAAELLARVPVPFAADSLRVRSRTH